MTGEHFNFVKFVCYSFIPSPACYPRFRLNVKKGMYCHNKFITGYLKNKDLNDTNEPQCSRKVERICRKMPLKSEMTAGITLIKKKKKEGRKS